MSDTELSTDPDLLAVLEGDDEALRGLEEPPRPPPAKPRARTRKQAAPKSESAETVQGGRGARSEAGEDLAERPPQPRPARSGGVIGRLRNRLGNRKTGESKPPKPKPPRGRRISIASDIEGAYGDLGRRLEYSVYYPSGRMLTYQAPAAGVIIDRAVAGTLIDRAVIQPIWRSKDKWEDVAYLTAPPILLAVMQGIRVQIQQAMEAGDMDRARQLDRWLKGQGEILAWIMRHSLERLAEAKAVADARRAESDEKIREAFPDLPPGIDPVQALISALFAPPGSEEAANVGNVNVNGGSPTPSA